MVAKTRQGDGWTLTDDPEALSHPVLAMLLASWRTKERDGEPPLWIDFSPRDVKLALPWLVVLEALPGYVDFRYRIVGSWVAQYFLADGSGKTVTETFFDKDPRWAGWLIRLYRRPCKTRRPVHHKGIGGSHGGVYFPAYDRVHLPYCDENGDIRRVVSALTFDPADLAVRNEPPTPLHILQRA